MVKSFRRLRRKIVRVITNTFSTTVTTTKREREKRRSTPPRHTKKREKMNADEASRCMDIANEKLSSAKSPDDLDSALKFAKKAVKLNASLASDVAKLVREIQRKKASGFASSSSSTAAARGEARAKEATASRTAQETKKEYVKGTAEQEKLMREIQAKKNDYYAVLSVERTATENEIKKAYRKLAVKIHPDKCQGTGAEEAFKIVSKAFACLSDAEKRAAYDRYGSEEGPQGMPGMRRRHAGQAHSPFGGFDDDIDPREIFNMFFGGGMPGVRFHTFGGNGFHSHGFHSSQQRARQQQRYRENRSDTSNRRQSEPEDLASAFTRNFMQMIPILLFLFLWAFSPAPEVHYQLFQDSPNSGYTTKLQTKKLEVPYYVKSKAQFDKSFTPGTFNRQRMEQTIERDYQGMLENSCLYERGTKERMLRSYSRDQREKGKVYEMPHCERLKELRRKMRG